MKSMEITFQTLTGTLKHQWKIVLATLVLFALIGVGAGKLYAGTLSADAGGRADELAPVDFSTIAQDANYYYFCGEALQDALNQTIIYVRTLAEEATLTGVQKAALLEYKEALDLFEREHFRPIQKALDRKENQYVPTEHIREVEEYYEQKVSDLQRDIIISGEAAELIKNMQAPAFQTESIAQSYEGLLAAAAMYGSQLREIRLYETILDNLADRKTVLANGRWMESALEEAVAELNPLMADISAAAQEIAQENYLDYLVGYNIDGEMQMTLNHTHRAVSAQENFAVIVIFCTLVGACAGAFFALCREAKAEEKRKLQAEE